MSTSKWYLYKLSSHSLACLAHLNIFQVVTAVLIGFLPQVYLHFMKGSVPLSQRVILDSFPSYSGKKKAKKMDKKWLMWVIIFTIPTKYSTLKVLFILFLFGPLRNKTLGEILTYWKSIDFSQPFLKSKRIIMAFLKHKKWCLTLIIPSFYWFGWLNILSLN